MNFQNDFDRLASCEFGNPRREARVDPAKTLGLIKRIQQASDHNSTGQLKAVPQPKIKTRVG